MDISMESISRNAYFAIPVVTKLSQISFLPLILLVTKMMGISSVSYMPSGFSIALVTPLFLFSHEYHPLGILRVPKVLICGLKPQAPSHGGYKGSGLKVLDF